MDLSHGRCAAAPELRECHRPINVALSIPCVLQMYSVESISTRGVSELLAVEVQSAEDICSPTSLSITAESVCGRLIRPEHQFCRCTVQ